jgi:hypothetical protein
MNAFPNTNSDSINQNAIIKNNNYNNLINLIRFIKVRKEKV